MFKYFGGSKTYIRFNPRYPHISWWGPSHPKASKPWMRTERARELVISAIARNLSCKHWSFVRLVANKLNAAAKLFFLALLTVDWALATCSSCCFPHASCTNPSFLNSNSGSRPFLDNHLCYFWNWTPCKIDIDNHPLYDGKFSLYQTKLAKMNPSSLGHAARYPRPLDWRDLAQRFGTRCETTQWNWDWGSNLGIGRTWIWYQ